MFIFLFVSFAREDTPGKTAPESDVRELTVYVPSRSLIVLGLPFESLIHFEFVLEYGVGRWSGVKFGMNFSSFPSTMYRIACLSPIVYPCLLCHRPCDHVGLGLFPGSLFRPVDVCVCFYVGSVLF